MASSKTLRGPVRTNFTKALTELTAELNKEEYDSVVVDGLFKRLQSRRNKLLEMDQRVETEMKEDAKTTEKEFSDEYEEVNRYDDKYSDAEVMYLAKGKSKRDQESNSSKYRLPELTFMKFTGNPKEWLAFWGQFSSIHNDSAMSSPEKFQYLVQMTEERSQAREVVDSFPATEENYPKLISYLKTRFGDEDVLREVYARDLLQLVMRRSENTSVAKLYDKLETQLRCLESLGVTRDNNVALLYPMVESALPDETLKAWERSAQRTSTEGNRLTRLMEFLKNEVDSEMRFKMAKRGFAVEGRHKERYDQRQRRYGQYGHTSNKLRIPTANDLFVVGADNPRPCIFCERTNHNPRKCFNAKKMTHHERKRIIQQRKACQLCLRVGHYKNTCSSKIKCEVCGGSHNELMCYRSQDDHKKPMPKKGDGSSGSSSQVTSLTTQCSSRVMLETLEIIIRNGNKERKVRALFDRGSEHSYITKKAAKVLKLQSCGQTEKAHCLFGGYVTKMQTHQEYKIQLMSLDRTSSVTIDVMDKEKICGEVTHVVNGPWLEELQKKNVKLTDLGPTNREIHVLIGADVAGDLLGKRIIKTESGPVAQETVLGWTLMGRGKCTTVEETDTSDSVINTLQVSSLDLQDLWRLDLIGIHDATESKSRKELMESALEHFEKTVTINREGHYEVGLPWIENHPPVSKNRALADKRLNSAYRKLESTGYVEKYQKIFDEWLEMGVIERVEPLEDGVPSSYLPHRPVFKPNSATTPIRPVFDASARSDGHPSLNDCLEKGPNLIEMLPDILIRFRDKRYGVISDIKKAFLMISVRLEDRDFLRFVWIENGMVQEFRHCRVVFGVTSSPFILAATISHHLAKADDEDKEIAMTLKRSLYVDNSVASFDTVEKLRMFQETSVRLLDSAKLELRGWHWSSDAEVAEPRTEGLEEPMTMKGDVMMPQNGNESEELENGEGQKVPVLGLLWYTGSDELALDLRSIVDGKKSDGQEIYENVKVTKRIILSYAHKIFDPLGISCAVSLVPKLLLQDLWKAKVSWDAEVSADISKRFLKWVNELPMLAQIRIPRWLGINVNGQRSLHVFCDASKVAYSTCVFLREEYEGRVSLQLVMAKTRVSPTKKITIPRLELLGCLIGARITVNVKEVLESPCMKTVYWTDSSNALYWIKNGDNWSSFVWNRVKEIRSVSDFEDWRHVAGPLNPADLPSRGCTANKFVESRWWEGPAWLKLPEELWPRSVVQYDLETILAEKKKCVTSHVAVELCTPWYMEYFSCYRKIVRMIGWMLRFKNKKRGCLTLDEEIAAEIVILKDVQQALHNGHPLVKQLKARKDGNGIYRVRSKIIMRDDNEDFRFPILLPHDHPVVTLLVRWEHRRNCHAGHQALMSILRERYWIPKMRRTVRSVIYTCGPCRRQLVKKASAEEAPLPLNRVRDAAVFEITGVDLGGPLRIGGQQKVWFVVFTCAVYRAVHLELVSTLSTEGFLQSFRRFIARRGKPSVVYSDCGTNFEGAVRLLKQINWEKISTEAAAHKINWIFNPPSAPWWGGFWERIVGLMKTLIRRILGITSLSWEEMETLLCDLEQTVELQTLTT